MRWLKRAFWAAAWGVWFWLGAGLYRELPRVSGPEINHVRLGGGEVPHAFLHGTDHFVTLEDAGEDFPGSVRIWDARTGALMQRFDGPRSGPWDERVAVSGRWDVLVTPRQARHGVSVKDDGQRSSLLDLHSGEWTDLPPGTWGRGIFHPRRPWCLFHNDFPGGNEVAVIDLPSRQVIFFWDGVNPTGRIHRRLAAPFFVGDDRVALAIERTVDPRSWSRQTKEVLEVWPVVANGRAPEVYEQPPAWPGGALASSPSGRVAWLTRRPETYELDLHVYDAVSGRKLFAQAGSKDEEYWPSPTVWLSDDGRTALDARGRDGVAHLWDLDAGRLIWKQESPAAINHVDPSGAFEMRERWAVEYRGWRFNRETFAIRNMRDGALRFRAWASTLGTGPVNDTQTIWVDAGTKKVRWLPLRVDYPLLALCQTILALPLLLTWLALRWRGRRAAQRKLGVAAP